jgi:hypothetical protein
MHNTQEELKKSIAAQGKESLQLEKDPVQADGKSVGTLSMANRGSDV